MALSDRVLKGSVRRALDLIGDRWTLLILLSAFDGLDRFEEWRARFGISSSILSNRLKHLIKAGLIKKESVGRDSGRLRYTLTQMGEELFPWAVAVWNWERVWVFRDSEHPISLVHEPCGAKSAIRTRCGNCRRKLTRENISFAAGPGYDHVQLTLRNRSRRSKASMGEVNMEGHLGQSVDLIGDRWSFLVLSAAYFQVTRFDDFKEQLNIATNVLSDRLRRFTENGMLARNLYLHNPPRYEYILTEKSIEFFRVSLMLAIWGDKWLPVAGGDAFLRTHELCGKKLKVSIICENCDAELHFHDVKFQSYEVAAEL